MSDHAPAAPESCELNRAAAPAYWNGGILWAILASGARTGGSYSLMEELCPKDSGPPPHFHEQDEAFYIVEGELSFAVGDKIARGKSGSFVAVPRGAAHSFRVDSDTARVLSWYAPAGFERAVSELAEPTKERALPPKGLPPHADPQKAVALSHEVGMHMADGPDPLRLKPESPQYASAPAGAAPGDDKP